MMLCAFSACAFFSCIASSSSLISSSSPAANPRRSIYVSRNGLVQQQQQQLAVNPSKRQDHRTMRRAPTSPCADAPCPDSFMETEEFHDLSLEAQSPDWSYENQDTWQSLNSSWSCNGARQSPVALSDSAVNSTNSTNPVTLTTVLSRLSFTAEESAVLARNTGHSIQVDAPHNSNFGQFSLPDGTYVAMQFNFHLGTEHIIDGGKQDLMEMHIVFQKSGSTGHTGGDIAVIGILLQDDSALGAPRNVSKQTDLLDSIRCNFTSLPLYNKSCVVAQELVNLTDIFRYELEGQYFHYIGSLTTPPCTEGVHWYVMKRRAAVNSIFVTEFSKRLPSNKRTLQARNQRYFALNNLTVPAEITQTSCTDSEFGGPGCK